VVKAEVIRKRLNKLDEYLSILRSLQQYSFDEFMDNPERYGSVERFLHLAIEAVTDMGNHIIADDSLGQVNWYSDIPQILAEKGYISGDLQERWIQMIGFRNVLVHEYADIDRKIVYNVLQNNLRDIKLLRQLFAQFL
jgi:uncharacterized protein YutE (UPF0331/DUF86 family)